jgi:hypothetical protein
VIKLVGDKIERTCSKCGSQIEITVNSDGIKNVKITPKLMPRIIKNVLCKDCKDWISENTR